MTNNAEDIELKNVIEGLFGDKQSYYTLYDATGEEAIARIADINKRGHKAVMESLLSMPTLKASSPSSDKPWSLLDHTYTLGNYTLAWSAGKEPKVLLVETIDVDSPYAVDPETQVG